MAELLGQHRYQLDTKGRIALPSGYRDAFADGVYLTLGQDGCLFAYPADEWRRRSNEVRARPLSGQEARAYARMFFGSAESAELDGQGRLVIPQRLRNQVGLSREVVVVGVSERLEIWASEAWERYEQAYAGAYSGGTLEPEGQ
ncbi:MAG TPA: division/cell wall cluster transcriptional repressor MraZ [Actinomycetota bacterium]|nr:division/cell wall cluster transcriptional repressor MraZ [Actinomycetota bacterium]